MLEFGLTISSYILNIKLPIDIKLAPQNILNRQLKPCIQFYDYSHQLIREIITRGEGNQVVNPWHFCLDREFNILLTDWSLIVSCYSLTEENCYVSVEREELQEETFSIQLG